MTTRNASRIDGAKLSVVHGGRGTLIDDDVRRDVSADDPTDVAKRAAVRLFAFLEREIEEELPDDHPTALRYRRAADRLRAGGFELAEEA